ncbi:hypothetical protein WJX77_005351 [Trebouxia sp. C0004]
MPATFKYRGDNEEDSRGSSQQLSTAPGASCRVPPPAASYPAQERAANRENNDLRNRCGQLEHRLHSQQQQQTQKLADFDRKFAEDTARNEDLQQKLNVLAQHLKEEDQKKSGGCTLSIAFDTQQRQDQYMEAVRGLLQPIEDKYVLNIETLQAPKPCSFLLYVTYSSSHRLVNFDNDAFERFKQSCSTENAVILEILQLNARKTPQTLLQRFFGGFRLTGSLPLRSGQLRWLYSSALKTRHRWVASHHKAQWHVATRGW